ncbi:Probable RNA-directed DNA polymerase from transposon BS [Eumeta japonica]|uniref:Probable RNA-directed DNA polymerase from transposon BS n=1 Tax=Eumeta variegata TaxID=151549 RepID=A0A4C1ZK06_EUMVA|nr:Probable RNA-directed DNA polymerase from transposon BS [Eumeta japonica]
MGPDGGRPISTIKITDWKKVSTAFEKSTLLRSMTGRLHCPRRRGGSGVHSTLSRLNALTPPPRTTQLILVASRKRFFKNLLEPRDDLTPVSLSEVQTLVKSLKTRKAPGLDGISNKAIKCFPQQLLRLLVAIFNACLQNCYFPPVWKEAEVIGIHKPGKPRDLPASYRPISLLSGLSKLYERVLKTRLTDHLLGKGLIIDEQFGFRPAHSCPQQVLRLVEYATEGFKRKNKTVAIFFDVAKAFDRVWHAGVPQGSALSTLYSAYTNDIPRQTSGVQLALFADDTALFYRNRYRDVAASRLQRAIDELGQWFRLWRIEVSRSTEISTFEITSRVLERLRFSTQQGRALLGRKSKLSRRNKRTIYKMCIRTVMTYASPVFAHAAPKTLQRLQLGHRLKPHSTARPPQTAPRPENGNRPVTVSSDAYAEMTPSGDVHRACHAPSALTCRPAALGEAMKSSDRSPDSSPDYIA